MWLTAVYAKLVSSQHGQWFSPLIRMAQGTLQDFFATRSNYVIISIQLTFCLGGSVIQKFSRVDLSLVCVGFGKNSIS